MSKFADILKRAYSHNNQPLGFRKPLADKEITSMLLVADVTSLAQRKVKEIVAAGVDGLIIYGATSNESSPDEIGKIAGDVPLGIALGGDGKTNKIVLKAGPDFITFDLTAGPDLPLEEGLGRLLVVSETIMPGMIKAINELSMEIDGVVMDYKEHKLDIQFILTCHLFSDLLNKPLLVRLYQRNVTDAELKALMGAGVRGLLLPAEIPVSGIKTLKKSIASLPAVIKKLKRAMPLIPGISISQKEAEEVVEVEEGEEDE